MEFLRLSEQEPGPQLERLARLFTEIEKKLRLSGKADYLLALDRLPAALMGPTHQLDSSSMDLVLAQATNELNRISTELSKPQT